jgi:type II secretory pathway component PulF
MGEFVCRVADANGRVYSHVEAAGTQAEARQKLADRGLYVYSVENRSSLLSGMLQRQSSRKIGGSDFLILNQQFNTLIKAGLPILRALDLLAERAASPRLRPIIAQIRDRVREGKSLSEAVNEAGVFSKGLLDRHPCRRKERQPAGGAGLLHCLPEGEHRCP